MVCGIDHGKWLSHVVCLSVQFAGKKPVAAMNVISYDILSSTTRQSHKLLTHSHRRTIHAPSALPAPRHRILSRALGKPAANSVCLSHRRYRRQRAQCSVEKHCSGIVWRRLKSVYVCSLRVWLDEDVQHFSFRLSSGTLSCGVVF